tara:strand:+ start:4399 stop:4824 length:426 start_codon:yes stop_codon:yes gene_type:complete
MYTYKALVGCLPATNKIKLVNMINQNSSTFIDVQELAKYEFGIICQANATYVGVLLVRKLEENSKYNYEVEHMCVAAKHRKNGYGHDIMQALKGEFESGVNLVTRVRNNNEAWLSALIERWDWKRTEDSEDEEYQTYTMTL